MRVKSVIIEFELDGNDIPNHATRVEFKDRTWTTNGPCYSRINGALHMILKLLRGQRNYDQY